jgi:aldose 1-epimerase
MEVLNLQFKDWDLQVSPKYGACILSCSYSGFDVLRTAKANWKYTHDPMLSSYFPLVPYSNRIANGQFKWENKSFNLNPNHSDQKFPLHGIGWLSEWAVKDIKENSCTFEYKHIEGDWPWPFLVRQKIALEDSSIKISLTLKNMGEKIMPSGLGFHLYFPLTRDVELQFNAEDVWLSDENNLPTELVKIPNQWDFSKPGRVFKTRVDNCFSGYGGKANIIESSWGHQINLSSSPSLGHCVFYAPSKGGYFCLEPVNHMNNALAYYNESGDLEMPSLKPGEINHVEMSLSVIKNT